jgi:hypothetical protein
MFKTGNVIFFESGASIYVAVLLRQSTEVCSENAMRESTLSANQPHDPASHKDAPHEHGKAIQAIADLFSGGVFLGNPEDNRGEESEDDRGREVRQRDGHGFFPNAT